MSEFENLVEVKHLKEYFPISTGVFKTTPLKAVDDVSFAIRKGETLGLVGESGCGKTTVGRTLLHLYKPTDGEIWFNGKQIVTKEDVLDYRKKSAMVFQDPYSSLNPRMTVSDIIAEPLDVHKLYASKAERQERVLDLMAKVGLNSEHASRYAHEFSGGQRQRIGLARAMVMEPELVIADEPISALDVSIRAQVLNLLKKFQKEKDITYLFIAHDLSIVRFISDRIGVIYKGDIVEIAEAEELFNFPLHPYTRSLISAIPIPDPQLEKNKVLFTYDPSIHDYSEDKPKLVDVGHNHFVFGNEKEIEEYKAVREKGEKLKSITILPADASQEQRNEAEQSIPSSSGLLDVPLHDTGSKWYSIASFFLPILGLPAAFIFKKFRHLRNYKACLKGALMSFGTMGVIVALFCLLLLLAAI